MTAVTGIVNPDMQPFLQPSPAQVAELEAEGYTGGYDEADAEEEGRVGDAPYATEEEEAARKRSAEELARRIAEGRKGI